MARNVGSSTKWYSRAFCSPGRGARVVYEVDSLSPGVAASSARVSEFLPAPDGAVITKRRPLISSSFSRLLDVLHLLADLLYEQLQLERAVRQLLARRLGGERVGLAVELLREEVQALADGSAFAQRELHFAQMRPQAVELLAHVDLGAEKRELGPHPVVVGRADGLLQPLGDSRLVGRDRLRHQRPDALHASAHGGDPRENARGELRA